MSKINAVRFINVNYNNNAIRISDETFHLNGESTLLSLRNGGGKSVLVQMLTAPFVHKRYRDAKDRPFDSYFTTNKPSFILVEWALDQGAGYVLTGMMVRRSQVIGEQTGDSLEMVNFISEYRESCIQDIHHLPVVEKRKKEMVLKNFSACRQLFESYKKDRSVSFFHYDMNNSAQSRQYFEKLKEYQINYKEWETIIRKVNLKESGLSELFADCKDEKGLVEKWFLDAVENKLNKDKNRMKEFQTIVEKYVGQYKDNQSKIQRRDVIRHFKEESARIQEKAEDYQEASRQEKSQENRIIHFIMELEHLSEETKEQENCVSEDMENIRREIARVEYEKLSGEIHQLKDQERFHLSNRDMIAMEQEALEREADLAKEKLYLLFCAKQQERVDENHKELEVIRQKLLVSRQKDADLEPERNRLGYTLWCRYQDALNKNEELCEKNQDNREQTVRAIDSEKEKISFLDEEILKAVSLKGTLKARVEAYDQQEERFLIRYQEQFVRNILGEYEPGFLEIRRKEYEQELEGGIRNRAGLRKKLELAQSAHRGMERKIEDLRGEQIRKSSLREQIGRQKAVYEQELEVRKVILKYLNLEEKDVFSREKILQVSKRKLLEIEQIRRTLEKEEDELQKEYQRLTQGKILELPKEFEALLKELGIPAIYGMEWLQKNGYSEEKNQKMVRSHPFLPYALILSRQELEKLSQHAGELYTSVPIPIVLREELEGKGCTKSSSIVRLDGVNFYVLFNENLLDEEKLSALVQEREWQIQKKQETIEIRKREYREYFERQELVKNQAVTQETYQETEQLLGDLNVQLQTLDGQIRQTMQEMAGLQAKIEQSEKEIHKTEQMIEGQRRRLEDYDQLCQAYESYCENRRELELCRKNILRQQDKKQLAENRKEKLQEQLKSLETEKDGLFREQKELKEEAQRYQSYKETEMESGETSRLEARYRAITAAMSQEIQDLEEQEQRAGNRYEESREELEHLRQKYRLKQNAWKGIFYSRKEESHQEVILEDKRRKIEAKKSLWNGENTKLAVIVQQMKERTEKMQIECGKQEPLPKDKIQDQDFEARKNQLRFQEKEALKQADFLRKRRQNYDENLTALSEYTDFQPKEKIIWEQDFREMDGQKLRNFKGILIRDYNQKVRDGQRTREQLVQVLNQVVRMEDFQEDFYKKPLEAMLELSYDAEAVLGQLYTTIQSYESLMEKLEVDISLVEKEKGKIAELLEDYVREVHLNLGKIDQNSTITIRERPVKMLKIQLPQWEEHEGLYRIRLQDFIDEITQKGLKIFEKNENAQEYFGTRITTRNLYDTIIGTGNVQIRLYKIEEQREYAITWAEVARNSGGEGFLSAFVILSSLLYYMRKDDSDIFADRNEGKVLVMDNPFAQTNASHLLKPLMDMAKKTNTQLICLTGLGGESIYNRFDNIYVLNLIAASLRNGMQYLKADHLRGNESETMVASRIQVMEQQELIF